MVCCLRRKSQQSYTNVCIEKITQTSCQRPTQELVWYGSLSCFCLKVHLKVFVYIIYYGKQKCLKLLIKMVLDNFNIGLLNLFTISSESYAY